MNITKAAKPSKTKFTRKKFALFSYPSHKVAKIPDSLFPIEVERNHPPIIKAVNRLGLNFETRERPIGLKNNSPIVTTP